MGIILFTILAVFFVMVHTVILEMKANASRIPFDSAAEARRKEKFAIWFESLGPPPSSQVTGMTTAWVVDHSMGVLSGIAVAGEVPIFGGCRLAPKPPTRDDGPINAPNAFEVRYDLVVAKPGHLAFFPREMRDALLRAYPVRVDQNQFLMKMNSLDRFDIDDDTFVSRWHDVDSFLGNLAEAVPELPALLIMTAVDPSPHFRRRALLAAFYLFFEKPKPPAKPSKRKKKYRVMPRFDQGFSVDGLTAMVQPFTSRQVIERFGELCPKATDTAFEEASSECLFGGLVEGLLTGYADLIPARAAPEALPFEATSVYGGFLFFLAVLFPERVTVAELFAWGEQSEELPMDLMPLLISRLPKARSPELIRVVLQRGNRLEDLAGFLQCRPEYPDIAVAEFAGTESLEQAFRVFQLLIRMADPRWKEMIPKLTDLVEAGADVEKDKLSAVVGILMGIAAEEVTDEIAVMQRLAPFCYTFDTRIALVAARQGVAQRAGVPLIGQLSVVTEEAAGALSAAAERDGDLSQPEQPPKTERCGDS